MTNGATFGDFFLLGLFLALSAGLVVVAWRVGQVEWQGGLPRSRWRLPATLGAFVVVATLVGLAAYSSLRPSAPPPSGERPSVPPEVAEQLAKLRADRWELQAKVVALNAEIRRLVPPTAYGD